MSSPLTDLFDSEPEITDIDHLLKSNQAPDASQAAALQQEVDTLTPIVSRLRAQLGEAEERLLNCQMALSSIRKFPQEILVQIFRTAYDNRTIKDRRTLLATLGQVSKMWRNAAYDPSHWASVLLELGKASLFKAAEDVETVFKNAKDYPRSVTLWGDGCNCGNPTDPPREWVYCMHQWRIAIHKLLCSPSPIRHLAFSQTSLQCFTNLVASLDGGPDLRPRAWLSLASLDLRFTTFPEARKSPSRSGRAVATYDLVDLPASLADLSLSLPSCPDRVVPNLNINVATLNNLTWLSIDCDWEAPVILNALRNCTNLKVLHIDYNWSHQSWGGFEDIDTSDVLLPHVHTLDLRIRKLEAATKVLPLLKLPNLVNLRIFSQGGSLSKALDCLGIFSSGQPSAPTLQLLSIWFSPHGMGPPSHWMNAEDLVGILSRIPSLRHLALDGACKRYVLVGRLPVEFSVFVAFSPYLANATFLR